MRPRSSSAVLGHSVSPSASRRGADGAAGGDDDVRYRALVARDGRFDGWFFAGVTSTGIYCRASCPSVKPRRDRVRFFPTSAAAQRAGFRACKRCRPDAAPGSPEWDRRGDVIGRAMRSIHEGVIDREGVSGLARRLGYSPRQLQRLLVAEVGAGPLELARAQRAETARVLLETTDLRIGEIVFAAGFKSVRQFNDTLREIFDETPRAMRARAGRRAGQGEPACRQAAAPRSVTLRLAYRQPFPVGVLFRFLAERAVPGVEEGDGRYYRRAVSLPGGAGVATVCDGGDGALRCSLQLQDLRDLTLAVQRVKHVFDLDADPAAVGGVLGADPVLGPAVTALPGLRIPGHVDGGELAVRAVLGQQVSVPGARTLAGRLALAYGRPLSVPVGSVQREFPRVEVIAGLPAGELPMPGARGRALVVLAEALAGGELALDRTTDRDAAVAQLLSLPGIGPWTVAYVSMRALGDPDAFMPSDLGVRRALERLGQPAGERQASALAERWRPYRAYALQYLWHLLGAGAGDGNRASGGADRKLSRHVQEGLQRESHQQPQREKETVT
ncbi:MAG TPA: AlkA N-terminal domain-containing protein [Acidimicrobiales bacterium]|nr:AlkA N-terminal domain-containing protein [Acidimicrobiales bacterium]